MVIKIFLMLYNRYEGQRDMLYNQTFNLDQVAFASEGIKDAQQTVTSVDPFCDHRFAHLLPLKREERKEKCERSIADLDSNVVFLNQENLRIREGEIIGLLACLIV